MAGELMLLTQHQQFHVEAVSTDAMGLSPGLEKTRILDESIRFLDGTDDWPSPKLSPHEIHEYIENPARRA